MPGQLFVNGKVFTGRSEEDFVTAFRIADGVFTWVGDDPGTFGEPTVDLQGRTVLPGLLDVHTHPGFMSALVDAVSCLPPRVGSLAGLIKALRTHPNLGGGPDRWIEGFGYDESAFPEGRGPTADDLDRVSRTQPVIVRRCDGHSAVANHRALALSGITADVPDPQGAAYGRDANGVLTGELIESNATHSVARLIPVPDQDHRARNLSRLDEHYAQRGIVAVADLWATMIPDPLRTFRDAQQLGLRTRCALYYGWPAVVEAVGDHLADEDRTGQMRIAGVKLFMDGAYANRTAWTEDPYPGSHSHGIRTLTDSDLRDAVDWARRNRVQVAVHAMGDRALNHVIDMFGDDEPWMGELPSIRLEHATLFSGEMIDRLVNARMSFAVITHSIFLFAEFQSYERNLSSRQFEIAYPIRSLYERVRFTALSSDSPTTAWAEADDVFVSVQAAVCRRSHTGADIGQAEAVTVPQALLLYTGRAGALVPMEGLGMIRPGYEASFVVLDRDVFTVHANELDRVRVIQTWIRGDLAYTA